MEHKMPEQVTEQQVDAFKAEWQRADADGDIGNRVRRGLIAAFAARLEIDEAKLAGALQSAMRDNAMLFDNGTEEWIAESDPAECLPDLAQSLVERRGEWLGVSGDEHP